MFLFYYLISFFFFCFVFFFFFFKQKTAYEIYQCDWSSDVCSSDLLALSSVLLLSGCSSLMHPKSKEFYTQAKGATGQQTALALLAMMETSVQQDRKSVV